MKQEEKSCDSCWYYDHSRNICGNADAPIEDDYYFKYCPEDFLCVEYEEQK